MTCRKKFTLLELLIVIAVIALLLSLLLPSLGKARYMARVAVCASNLKQNSTAMVAYTMANDKHLPTRGLYTTPQYHRYFWVSNINDYTVLGRVWQDGYISSPESLFCPEANILRAGTFKSYDYYLINGEFDAPGTVVAKSSGAARSNYIFYPYQKTNASWNKLLLPLMDSDEMFMVDDLWTNSHILTGNIGWNTARVDLSQKFIRNKAAYDYALSESNVWNDWGKTNSIRNMLMNNF